MDIKIPNLLNLQPPILPTDIPIHPLPPINLCVNLCMEMVRYYRNANSTGRGYQGRRWFEWQGCYWTCLGSVSPFSL